MQDNGHFTDVIVVGGGPTGLLLASKLSPHMTVRLIERNRLGQTSKFWLTAEHRLARHHLLEAVQCQSRRATLGTFQGSFAYAEGAFTVINDCILLRLLIERCRRESVKLVENAKVLNIVRENADLLVQTTNGSFRARLILDASGGGSPFAATFRLHQLEGFYSIYGGHLRDLTLHTEDIVGAHVIHLGHPAPIFEIMPTGPDSAFCVVFTVGRKVIDPKNLSDSFEEHVCHNPFFTAKRRSAQRGEIKMGIIPIGRAMRRTIPGILPVGEAALVQSPLLGAALNEILEYGDRIVEAIVQEFDREKSGIICPNVTFPPIKILNDRLQMLLVRPLLDGTLKSFEKLVQLLKDLGPSKVYRLFATQLGLKDMPAISAAAARYLLMRY